MKPDHDVDLCDCPNKRCPWQAATVCCRTSTAAQNISGVFSVMRMQQLTQCVGNPPTY